MRNTTYQPSTTQSGQPRLWLWTTTCMALAVHDLNEQCSWSILHYHRFCLVPIKILFKKLCISLKLHLQTVKSRSRLLPPSLSGDDDYTHLQRAGENVGQWGFLSPKNENGWNLVRVGSSKEKVIHRCNGCVIWRGNFTVCLALLDVNPVWYALSVKHHCSSLTCE